MIHEYHKYFRADLFAAPPQVYTYHLIIIWSHLQDHVARFVTLKHQGHLRNVYFRIVHLRIVPLRIAPSRSVQKRNIRMKRIKKRII